MKKLVAALILLGLIVTLGACSFGNVNIESLEETEKQEYLSKSTSILDRFMENDFSPLIGLASDEFKSQINEEDLQSVLNNVNKNGDFKEFGKSEAVRYEDENLEQTYVVTQIEAVFENKTIIFTLNYDDNGKIIGFFMK